MNYMYFKFYLLNYMFCVHKRNISLRCFFHAHNTKHLFDRKKNISNRFGGYISYAYLPIIRTFNSWKQTFWSLGGNSTVHASSYFWAINAIISTSDTANQVVSFVVPFHLSIYNSCIDENSAVPDQLAWSEASWSETALFSKNGIKFWKKK